MHILLLNHEYPPIGGGAGNAAKHLAEELAVAGVGVDVVTSGFHGLPRLESNGRLMVHRIPAVRSRELESTNFEISSFTASALFYGMRLASHRRPDLVHTFFGLPSGALGYALKSVAGLPYLISFRGRDVHGGKGLESDGITGVFRTLSRPVWRHADRLVANSEGLRSIAQRVTPDLPIDVIPNGVDTNRFSPGSVGEDGPVGLLFVGRLEPYKGLDTLLTAVAALKDRAVSPFTLTVVGDGSLRDDIRKRVAALGIDDCVDLRGRVAPDDMPDIYRAADAFVLPSIVEGMSNGILEALAAGLPVVGTRIPGSEELVDHGANGLLVPAEDAEALTDALARLIDDPAFRTSAGRAARKSVEERSWRSIAERYLNVYDEILQEKASCAA